MDRGQVDILTVDSWKILGFGSQHVVFEYDGSEGSPFWGKVLRVRIKSFDFDDFQIAELEQSLANYVGNRYLDRKYLLETTVIKLSEAMHYSLQNEVQKLKKFTDSSIYNHALLCINMFRISRRVFELKPKWNGCMVSLNDHQESRCPYCSHKKRIIDNSKYCPAHLFSSTKEHVYHAVKHYPFKELGSENHRSLLSEILYHDGILRTLKAVHDHNCFLGSRLAKSYENYTDSMYLSLLQSHICGETHSAVAEFLISFSLKDCSIFIVIDDEVDVSHQQLDHEGTVFSYAIYVIDTDIKPVNRLQDYIRKNKMACRNDDHISI